MLDLRPIKERAEKATDGPWIAHKHAPERIYCAEDDMFASNGRARTDPRGPSSLSFTTEICRIESDLFHPEPLANRNFIQHAREDIPALIGEVERLRYRLVALEAV